MGLFREFGNPLARIQQKLTMQRDNLRSGLEAVVKADEGEAVRRLAQLRNQGDIHKLAHSMATYCAQHGDLVGVEALSRAGSLSPLETMKLEITGLTVLVGLPENSDPVRQQVFKKKIEILEKGIAQLQRR